MLEPAPQPSASVPDEAIKGLRPEKRADGSHALVAPWPMNTEQLRLVRCAVLLHKSTRHAPSVPAAPASASLVLLIRCACVQLINTADGGPWRHVHLANATQLVGRGFADASVWAAFDANIVKYKAYWCCRCAKLGPGFLCTLGPCGTIASEAGGRVVRCAVQVAGGHDQAQRHRPGGARDPSGGPKAAAAQAPPVEALSRICHLSIRTPRSGSCSTPSRRVDALAERKAQL